MIAGVYPLVTSAGVRSIRRRSGQGGALPAAMVAAEWALSIAVNAARPLGLLGLPVGWAPRRGPRPIVLIHGYAMSRAGFLLLARRLHRAGLGPIYGFEYWTLGTVADAARQLGAYVEAVAEAHAADKVDVIGHSMGGVVARYYATLGGGAARIARLVTLGSPHRGTETSLFGLGRPTKELLPDSPLVARLERAGLPDGVAMTVIWSRADSLVWCERQAHCRGAEEIVYDDLGHIALLASRRVARQIIERLSRR
jgi:triacylglycerol lipase